MNRVLKSIVGATLSLCVLVSAAACTSAPTNTAPANAGTDSQAASSSAAPSAKGKKVGVAMPTKSSERWIRDGNNMKDQLEKLGYAVDLQYAEDDVQAQVSQIENMITSGANCLVVASIDSSALVNVLEEAKKNSIPVIAYDRLLMDTDAVSYYATFDNKGVGTLIGKYIEEKAGLKDGKGPYNIELFAGSPDDNNAHFLNTGAMEVLQPYIDDGKLKVVSGQTDFDKICILRWSQETAQKRMEDLLSGYYSTGKDVDIVLSPFDGISYGIAAALEGAGYKVGEKWPMITGQDAETMAVKNIQSGKQSMTVFKDTRVLAAKCVTMVQAVLEGKEPEINDKTSYNNGKLVVPSYLCNPVAIDKDNIQKELIDSGYYKQSDIS
ncbi:Multiple sugar-binding periplasmic receptor ChvE [Caprobacter fermentans]|uniref:Multiple sugar-binding periplasmic receptor ChvE n=1 Tax=Caproicibacter fermentans TaxID=2576756 RepID=A0A6N8I3G7_9FIRM|nr:multiple monosaccharide ABC transporter substrate-binding protein [Caproicibacter fermentans]MVB12572.1 Multiple sugar-binding periplasmic receptor ChvE [Caproicibacter fermentans]OCN00022.1 sugar ABC transporter substrate-binding protein [Clostridium sp. W14A]QNK39142.1 sugar-binding protein [Caproicibacter fermentans]